MTNNYKVTYSIDHPSFKRKEITKEFYLKQDFIYFYLMVLRNRKLTMIVSNLKAFKNNIDVTKKLNIYIYSNRI